METKLLLIGGAIVFVIVYIYWKGGGGGSDYLLDNFERCSEDKLCKSGVCCNLEGYDGERCAPKKTDCLGSLGKDCRCNDGQTSISPCTGNCMDGLTCCDTADGWMCTDSPKTCLPSEGQVCSPNVGCREGLTCCKTTADGQHTCLVDASKCVGVEEGENCDQSEDCKSPLVCCHSKSGDVLGKQCRAKSECLYEEGWACDQTADCYKDFECCSSDLAEGLSCQDKANCRAEIEGSCKQGQGYPCVQEAKCCGKDQVCAKQCNAMTCTDNAQCGGLNCCKNGKCYAKCEEGSKCASPADCIDRCCGTTCRKKCMLGEPCSDNSHCAADLYCSGGKCVNKLTTLQPCSGNEVCASNMCCMDITGDKVCMEKAEMCYKKTEEACTGNPCWGYDVCTDNKQCSVDFSRQPAQWLYIYQTTHIIRQGIFFREANGNYKSEDNLSTLSKVTQTDPCYWHLTWEYDVPTRSTNQAKLAQHVQFNGSIFLAPILMKTTILLTNTKAQFGPRGGPGDRPYGYQQVTVASNVKAWMSDKILLVQSGTVAQSLQVPGYLAISLINLNANEMLYTFSNGTAKHLKIYIWESAKMLEVYKGTKQVFSCRRINNRYMRLLVFIA